MKNTISQLISRCNRGGYVYITHYFNDYDIDYLVRYRDNLNSKKKKLMKWVGMYFLKKTVSRILRKNKKVLRFKFLEIKFPKTLVLKKKEMTL